jgi:hypothetical protein
LNPSRITTNLNHLHQIHWLHNISRVRVPGKEESTLLQLQK